MSTVPHPVPSRMTHNVAALYGHTDDTLVAWQQACVHAANALQPPPAPERLAKALALAQDGAVTLADDSTATVPGHGPQPYTVRGTQCDCPDATKRGQPCKHTLAVQIHQQALALLAPPASAAPKPAAPTKRQARPRSSAAWDVHEAPVSSCFKIHVGTLEWTHTIRGSDDAELQTRVQTFLPTFRDIAAALEALHAEREAAKAALAAQAQQTPAPQPANAPTDLQALIQQAVQQALAAQASSTATPPATSPAPSAPPPALPSNGPAAANGAAPDDQQTGFCSIHQIPMEQKQNARGTFYGHWLAAEQRHCNGRRTSRR
jgi:hypothetical protein